MRRNLVSFEYGYRGEKLLVVCGRLDIGIGFMAILNWRLSVQLSIAPIDHADNVNRIYDALDYNRAAGVFCVTSAARRELALLLVSQYYDMLQIPLII